MPDDTITGSKGAHRGTVLASAANDSTVGPGDITVMFSTIAQVFVPAGAKVPADWLEIEEGGLITLDQGKGPVEFEVYDVEEAAAGKWIRAVEVQEEG